MTVYVESNFVLEIALGQEDAVGAEDVLSRAERGEIALALPALCIGEPFSTVTNRSRALQQMGKQLGGHLRELARSSPHHQEVRAIETIPTHLAVIEQREIERLTSTIGRILSIAVAIPFDVSGFSEANAIRSRIGLPPLDAMIYASVLQHLRTSDSVGPHFFVSRNTKDFDTPRIIGELADLDCEFLGGFGEAALRLGQPTHG